MPISRGWRVDGHGEPAGVTVTDRWGGGRDLFHRALAEAGWSLEEGADRVRHVLAENGFIMSTSYYAPAGISLRALLLDNQNRSYEFRHEPRFGARRRPPRPPRAAATVDAVRFSGKYGFAESELRSQLRLNEGDRFDFSTWQDDRDR